MHALAVLFLFGLAYSKTYERCELARELVHKHGIARSEVSTWVCIAEHESQYNTSAVGHLNLDSADHGIFQISDKYWCSPPGEGYACSLSCDKLEDEDITDDVACAKKIHEEHQYLSNDGFKAWAVYEPFCKGAKSAKYVKGCFASANCAETTTTTTTPAPVTKSKLIKYETNSITSSTAKVPRLSAGTGKVAPRTSAFIINGRVWV